MGLTHFCRVPSKEVRNEVDCEWQVVVVYRIIQELHCLQLYIDHLVSERPLTELDIARLIFEVKGLLHRRK